MKKVYIHCGLHKTGTTALQHILSTTDEALAKHGFLYPHSGRNEEVGGGHHNIPLQLSGSKIFNPRLGGVDELMAEIKAFDGTIILSTEALAHTLCPPGVIAELVNLFPPQEYEVFLVIYLRNQLAYCESLYIEHLGQGVAATYEDYIAQVERDGCLKFRDSGYPVDFRPMLDIATATGATVVLRNFHNLIGKSSITDFAALTGIDTGLLAAGLEKRSNMRLKIRASVTMFYANGLGRRLTNQERNCARLISTVIGPRRTGSRGATRRRFRELFAADNIAICERFGLAPTGLDYSARAAESDPPIEQKVTYERLYSRGTRDLIENMLAALLPHRPARAIELARAYFNVPEARKKDDAVPAEDAAEAV